MGLWYDFVNTIKIHETHSSFTVLNVWLVDNILYLVWISAAHFECLNKITITYIIDRNNIAIIINSDIYHYGLWYYSTYQEVYFQLVLHPLVPFLLSNRLCKYMSCIEMMWFVNFIIHLNMHNSSIWYYQFNDVDSMGWINTNYNMNCAVDFLNILMI